MRSEELLERADDLQAIEDLLAAARRGSGGCLVLEGAAGLGKSRLVSAARERARALEMEVLEAHGDDLERDFAFGAALQLFEAPMASLAGDERDRVLDGSAGLAAPLLTAGEAPAEGQQAFSITHGLHWVAANLAERRPLLLAVDDAHWIDAPTLRFLRYLLQRVDELPLALLVSARPDAGGPQERLLARIAGHPLAAARTLAPLSNAAVTHLVRAGLASHHDEELYIVCAAATGGNPFYLHELIAALSDGSEPGAEAVERLGPASVGRTVLTRLRSLSAEAGALAPAAAVLGDAAALDDVAELAGLEHGASAMAADELAAAAILEPGLPLRFRHPIVRDAVLGSLPAARRAATHSRAARLLLHRGADPERAAAHLVVSDAAGEPWAAEALRAAARSSRHRGAHDASALYLRAAISDRLPADTRRKLLAELAYGEAVTGAPEALTHAREAIKLLRSPRERAETALELGLALVGGGRHAESAELLDEGLRQLEQAGERAPAELAATLRAARAAIGGFDFAAEAPGGLEAILERTASGVATPSERLMLAHGAFAKGLAGEERDAARQLALGALAGPPRDAGDTTEMTALTLSATALVMADELPAAERALVATLDSARERGSVISFAVVSHIRAHVNFRLGRLGDAIADAQSVLDASRYGWEPALPAAHAVLSNALVERGELDAAAAALELPGGERRWSDSFTWNDYLEARAGLALARGDAEAALRDALACGERLADAGGDHSAVVPWRAVAARAAARIGKPEEAGRLAEEDIRLARRFGAPWALAHALRTAAELAGGDRGLALFRETLQILDGSPAALERAHALTGFGEALLAERHRVAARTPLREALELAHRCGAEALEHRARAAVVAAGARPRRPDLSGRAALTPRELRLARMAADGLGNREIAEALFITRKTVETHLARAYRKLGIASREELAAALGEREVS